MACSSTARDRTTQGSQLFIWPSLVVVGAWLVLVRGHKFDRGLLKSDEALTSSTLQIQLITAQQPKDVRAVCFFNYRGSRVLRVDAIIKVAEPNDIVVVIDSKYPR